jgi:hypothetical protein
MIEGTWMGLFALLELRFHDEANASYGSFIKTWKRAKRASEEVWVDDGKILCVFSSSRGKLRKRKFSVRAAAAMLIIKESKERFY